MNSIARVFGAHEGWVRPRPDPRERRRDAWLALIWFIAASVTLELMRSGGMLYGDEPSVLWQYLAVVTVCVLLVWRRSHPLLIAALASVHMVIVGILIPMVVAGLVMQILYFFAVYSGVAWARNRAAVAPVNVGILVLMFGWVAWMFVFSPDAGEIAAELTARPQEGLVSPFTATMLYLTLTNILYFGGAIWLGQMNWRGAHRTAQVVDQATTIADQADRLRDQAIIAERLRIARELHDVVAHHVSVMGVQAAAARRVLERDQQAATTALGQIEASSRQAVGQMRELLGTLRSGELAASGTDAGSEDRTPQPLLADLPDLISSATTPTCTVTLAVVEAEPGSGAQVAPPVQLSAYRVVQEALANVHKHSTASRVDVVVRVFDHVEVEVVDNGHPRVNTSGTGLGQVGIRERVAHLGGTAEIGPRHTGGYRVRVRFPAQPAAATEGAR